jgi:hypothetical protein
MFEQPRIVPHEVVNDDSMPHDQTYELDLAEYGEAHEPNGTFRVSQTPELRPSGHNQYLEGQSNEVDPHGEQPYYSKDASSGKQGAGQ